MMEDNQINEKPDFIEEIILIDRENIIIEHYDAPEEL